MVTGSSVSMLNSTKRLGSALAGNTVLCSHLSPPRCIKMGTCDLNAVRSPCNTGVSSKGNTKYSTSLHATEIRISSCCMCCWPDTDSIFLYGQLHDSMLVKQDQYVERSYRYVEFPYLFPNYNIYVQIAIYISKL